MGQISLLHRIHFPVVLFASSAQDLDLRCKKELSCQTSFFVGSPNNEMFRANDTMKRWCEVLPVDCTDPWLSIELELFQLLQCGSLSIPLARGNVKHLYVCVHPQSTSILPLSSGFSHLDFFHKFRRYVPLLHPNTKHWRPDWTFSPLSAIVYSLWFISRRKTRVFERIQRNSGSNCYLKMAAAPTRHLAANGGTERKSRLQIYE